MGYLSTSYMVRLFQPNRGSLVKQCFLNSKNMHYYNNNLFNNLNICKYSPTITSTYYNQIIKPLNKHLPNNHHHKNIHCIFNKSHNQHKHTSSSSYSKTSSIVMFGFVGILKSFFEKSDEDKEDTETRIKKIITHGVVSMLESDYSKAIDTFHEALYRAIEIKDGEQEFLILNLLASSYSESGNYVEAEKLYIDLIGRLIEKGIPETSPEILELSLKLAAVYGNMPNNYHKAEIGFNFVINNIEKSMKDLLLNLSSLNGKNLSEKEKNVLALLGWTYDWYSKYLLSRNKFKIALNYLEKALAISKVVLGPLNDQTLVIMNDLGTTFALDSDQEGAIEYIQQAVDGAIKSNSKELASFYLNLGLVNLKFKNLAQGQKYCKISLDMVLKDKDHYNYEEIVSRAKRCLTESGSM